MLILPFLIFSAVFLGIAALFIWLAPSRAEARLRSFAPATPDSRSRWSETMVTVVGPFARLSSPAGEWDQSPLRIKFMQAGIRGDNARLLYYASKTLAPVLAAGLTYFCLRLGEMPDTTTVLFYLFLAALVGTYLPNIVLLFLIRRRKREIFDHFADTADLMLVCVEAGMSLDAALTKVAEEMKMTSVALAEELHLTNLEMRAGGTREKSLRNLGKRTGVEEISTFATMLVQADRFGTSIGESLRVFSDDLRHKRQTRAEEAAAKVPTKMLFPLVLFVFPSIIMVIMGPAVIQIIRTLMPMLGGEH